jgi:hypothetical protein
MAKICAHFELQTPKCFTDAWFILHEGGGIVPQITPLPLSHSVQISPVRQQA